MFDALTIPDAWPILWLKRVFMFVIVVLLVIGAVSSHRAYFQVRSLELSAPQELSVGSVVKTSVVGSGRTMVDVEVDLIQGTHAERLLKLHLTGNELAFFDPRTEHASGSVVLTTETLSKFQPGPARLRAIATGREQWTRLPPPTVREMEVKIKPHHIPE
ncbi:MAG TPA: hypothetical protein VKB02_16040 [Pyrinomonadaceae bacterium]|nr:hypothetical protein [Pyrinomonadaceae bacterium]